MPVAALPLSIGLNLVDQVPAAATRAKVGEIEAVIAGTSEDALSGLKDHERQIARRVLEGLIAALEDAVES